MQLSAEQDSRTALTALQDELSELSAKMSRVTSGIGKGGPDYLGATDFVALSRLAAAGPTRLSVLAEAAGLDTSTISRRVASLESRGLIVRSKDPLDARATLLDVSDAGKDQLERHRRLRLRPILEVVSDWDPTDAADLARLLGHLNASLDTSAPGEPTR